MNVLTCVYCGHQYPEGTPPSQHQVLTDHIAICPKHPMKIVCEALAYYARSLDASDGGSVLELWEKDNYGKRAREAFKQLNLEYKQG